MRGYNIGIFGKKRTCAVQIMRPEYSGLFPCQHDFKFRSLEEQVVSLLFDRLTHRRRVFQAVSSARQANLGQAV